MNSDAIDNLSQMLEDLSRIACQRVAPLLLVALLTSVTASFSVSRVSGWGFRRIMRSNLAFALLGGTLGMLTGASKTPVLSTTLPALVTLVTVYLGYIVQKDTHAELRAVSPAFVFSLLIAAVFMAFYAVQ